MTQTARVYLAGPDPDDDDQYGNGWYSTVESISQEVEWVKPYEFAEEQADVVIPAVIVDKDITEVKNCHAMLLRRVDAYRQCGAYAEAGVAYDNGIPIIVWNDAGRDCPFFLSGVAGAIHRDPQTAVRDVTQAARATCVTGGEK